MKTTTTISNNLLYLIFIILLVFKQEASFVIMGCFFLYICHNTIMK